MIPGLAILLAIALIALVVFAARHSAEQQPPDAEAGLPAAPLGLYVPAAEFHVESGEASVYFDVPLPAGAPDPVLRDLLIYQAVEVVRRKRFAHFPLEGIDTVRAYGTRAGGPAEAGSVILDEPDILPAIPAPDLVPHAATAGYDPLAQIAEEDLVRAPGLAGDLEGDTLAPICEEVRLTKALDAGLRAQGIDPRLMSATDLTLGLLRIAGYSIVPGEGPGTFLATRGGKRTYLLVVDHHPEEHPELSERAIKEFAAAFATMQGVDHGLLITDKHGPYLIYDQERREPRCRYITRERLQAFVDSVAVS